jgi:hypothetical protein
MAPEVDLAKFFILNAKALKEMHFGVMIVCDDNPMATNTDDFKCTIKPYQMKVLHFGNRFNFVETSFFDS